MADRVSQVATEALLTAASKARVSQQAVEALIQVAAPNLRVSQQAIELLVPRSQSYIESDSGSLGDTGTLQKQVGHVESGSISDTATQKKSVTLPESGSLHDTSFPAGQTSTTHVLPIVPGPPSHYNNSESIQKGPRRFRITQITNNIQNENYTQTLRIERHLLSQDWNFGIGANIGLPQSTNATAIVTQSGFLSDVSLTNLRGPTKAVITNGQPLTDEAFQPYIFQWNGTPLTISITVANIPTGAKAYIWRWMYIAEDAYFGANPLAGNSTGLIGGPIIPNSPTDIWGSVSGYNTLPYDVRANLDTNISRRYWWPLLRPTAWITNDGITAMTENTTLIDTWSNGPGHPGTGWTNYGNLVVGKNDFFGDTTVGFVGQQLWASGNPSAAQLGTASTIRYGVDFGQAWTTIPIHYGIRSKQTPCYLNILVATTAGTAQFKKIAFMLTL